MSSSVSTFNLGHFVTQNALRTPDHPGVIEAGSTFTWAEVNRSVDRLARSMQESGIGPLDRVLVQARNSRRAFEVKWACFKLGATWAPVNFRLTPNEVAYMAAHSAPAAIFFDKEFEEHSIAASRALEGGPIRICLDGDCPGSVAHDAFLSADDSAFVEVDVERDHPAWFFYTSGTTGRPKAAVLTHGQLAFVAVSHLADMFPNTSEADASLVIAPLSHGAGVHALPHVARGASQIILTSKSLDPETVWKTVEQYQVTNFFAVPTLLKALVEHPSVDAFDHRSLRHVNYGGAPMLRSDQAHAIAKLGKVLVQHYGLGEFTANITILPPHLHESALSTDNAQAVGTCGLPRTGIEVGIFDTRGQRLPSGETGEICARGQAAFFGYHDDVEATAKAFKDGWFHTGDLGFLDKRGFVYITGRASDMYISGGLNVYPREIEEIILEDVRIAEVAVVGVPHPKWGESGVAVVVPRSGFDPTAEQIMGLLDRRVAKFKVPAEVIFWDELPKSAYGKILKREIVRKLTEKRDPSCVA
jgi:fatty-acyl-CoA synthase